MVALTSQGALLAQDLEHGAEAVRQVGDSSWEMRFRCPPAELPYWARTFYGFGPAACVVSPPELRDLVRDLIRQTAELYAVAMPDSDTVVSPFQD